MIPVLIESPILRVNEIFDRFFDDQLNVDTNTNASYSYDDENKEHVITVLAPGFKKDDIEIEVDNSGLIISGEIKNDNTKNKIHRSKFNYVMRKKEIDPDSIQGSLEDGILEVKFKTDKERSSKIIKIK